MTHVTETDYEVETKEIERELVECDVEDCLRRVEPEDAVTVQYYDGDTPTNKTPEREKHLCPEHTDLPSAVKIDSKKSWLGSVASGIGSVTINWGTPLFLLVIVSWFLLYYDGILAVISNPQLPFVYEVIITAVAWGFCAFFTLALIDPNA